MNKHEATQAIIDIRDRQIEQPGGVSTFSMELEFVAAYPNAEFDLGGTVFREWLHGRCRTLIKGSKPKQLSIPGLSDVSDVVTTYNGEGGFVYKRVRHSSDVDLENDLDIKTANVTAAQAEQGKTADRNLIIIPVMRSEGFATAGEAIDWLNNQTP